MESLNLPTTAAQAKAFISPSSLSFPMSQADQTSDISSSQIVTNNGSTNTVNKPGQNGTVVNDTRSFEQKETVTTGGVSGIVPTLQ
jgi:transcription initiation factor TFIID TATA-box-binding protein